MVERIVITMKECMAVNNPAEKLDFEKATIGVDLSKCEDGTYVAMIEHWFVAKVANTSYGLNVRSEPNMDSKLVAVIPNSDEFSVAASKSKGWYKAKLKDGTTGFVYSKYVSVIGG